MSCWITNYILLIYTFYLHNSIGQRYINRTYNNIVNNYYRMNFIHNRIYTVIFCIIPHNTYYNVPPTDDVITSEIERYMDVISYIIDLLQIDSIIKNINNISKKKIKYMKRSISSLKRKKLVRKSWD